MTKAAGAHVRRLLLLADTGGSNGCRCRSWKTELQAQLADACGLTLTVAHHPTGASKWNSIEHRLFPEISKNWAGEPLDSYQKVLRFIRTTASRVRVNGPRPLHTASTARTILSATVTRERRRSTSQMMAPVHTPRITARGPKTIRLNGP
jgi:hypothetical protein